jgi:hypothetical protein
VLTLAMSAVDKSAAARTRRELGMIPPLAGIRAPPRLPSYLVPRNAGC